VLVLLGARGIALDAVLAELVRREGTSGIVEKAGRSA
jgi:phosphoribosyl-ATP pyrophosphohydrolase